MLLQGDEVECDHTKYMITIKMGYIKNYEIYFTIVAT